MLRLLFLNATVPQCYTFERTLYIASLSILSTILITYNYLAAYLVINKTIASNYLSLNPYYLVTVVTATC